MKNLAKLQQKEITQASLVKGGNNNVQDPPDGIILIELEITFQETTPLS